MRTWTTVFFAADDNGDLPTVEVKPVSGDTLAVRIGGMSVSIQAAADDMVHLGRRIYEQAMAVRAQVQLDDLTRRQAEEDEAEAGFDRAFPISHLDLGGDAA